MDGRISKFFIEQKYHTENLQPEPCFIAVSYDSYKKPKPSPARAKGNVRNTVAVVLSQECHSIFFPSPKDIFLIAVRERKGEREGGGRETSM